MLKSLLAESSRALLRQLTGLPGFLISYQGSQKSKEEGQEDQGSQRSQKEGQQNQGNQKSQKEGQEDQGSPNSGPSKDFKGLIRPLMALHGRRGSYTALRGLIRLLKIFQRPLKLFLKAF